MFTHSSLISFSYLGLCIFHENNQHFQLLTSTKLPWNTHIYMCFLNHQQQTWVIVIRLAHWLAHMSLQYHKRQAAFPTERWEWAKFHISRLISPFLSEISEWSACKGCQWAWENLSVGWVSREAHKDYPLYQCDRAHIPMDRSWGEQHESELRKCSVNIWQITAAASCL